jgi:AcrR family transcriptional regulator
MAPADTRDVLVQTARQYLDEHGLEGLTLREVARRAHVSHGAPLRHFPSLAALCSVVATQGFRELYDEVAARMEGAGPDASSRLRAAGEGYVAFAVANPGPYSLMFRPDRCDLSDPELERAGQAAFAQLLFAVSEAQAEGWRRDDHTADLAGVVWAQVHGLATLSLQGSLPWAVAQNGGDPDLDHLIDLSQDLLIDPIPRGAHP